MNDFDEIRALGVGEILIPNDIVIPLRPNESFAAIAKNKQGELRELSFDSHDTFFVDSVSIDTDKQVIFKVSFQDESVLLDESDFDKHLHTRYARLAIVDVIKCAKAGSLKTSVLKSVSGSIKTKSEKVGIWA